MKNIWILVANQAEAQIYSTPSVPGSLMLVQTLANTVGTAHARDLVSDAPGRVHDRMGAARHRMEPDTSVKEEQRRRFVKEMVQRLEAGRIKSEFDRLVLVAAPAVLGVVRKNLPAELQKTVIREISKDVIGQGVDSIEQQLQRSFTLK